MDLLHPAGFVATMTQVVGSDLGIDAAIWCQLGDPWARTTDGVDMATCDELDIWQFNWQQDRMSSWRTHTIRQSNRPATQQPCPKFGKSLAWNCSSIHETSALMSCQWGSGTQTRRVFKFSSVCSCKVKDMDLSRAIDRKQQHIHRQSSRTHSLFYRFSAISHLFFCWLPLCRSAPKVEEISTSWRCAGFGLTHSQLQQVQFQHVFSGPYSPCWDSEEFWPDLEVPFVLGSYT